MNIEDTFINNLLKKETISLIYDLLESGKSKDDVLKNINESFIFQKEISIKKSLFSYLGGKQKLSKHIKNYIPDHLIYVEPFFGSGALFFAKGFRKDTYLSKYIEVINDLNEDLMNLYEMIRCKPTELFDLCDNILHIDSFKKKIKTHGEYYKSLDNLNKAATLLYNLSASFGSRMNHGFAFSKVENHRTRYLNKIMYIKSLSDRLMSPTIFNLDYKEVIRRFDTENTFIYLDPPYENTTKYETNKIDYNELYDYLQGLKSMWMLSHYRDSDFVRNNFENKEGVYIVDLNHIVTVCRDKSKHKNPGECIIMNYDINEKPLFPYNE